MRFEHVRSITGGQAADPDPRTNPGDVPFQALLKCPETLGNSDTIPGRLILALEGTAAQTASVEIWALDEPPASPNVGNVPSQAQRAARQFHEATAAPIVVTVGALAEHASIMPMPGIIYVRITAAPAGDAVLKVACAN